MSNTKQALLDYLSKMVELRRQMMADQCGFIQPAGQYICTDHYIMDKGRWWPNWRLPSSVRRGRKKECFKNAGELTLDQPDLYRYVEGYVYSCGFIPVLHAWCVNASNRVIDPTLDYARDTLYFGVLFDCEFLRDVVLVRKVWGILGPDFPYAPLLRTGNQQVDCLRSVPG